LSDSKPVRLEIEGKIAKIILNRPEQLNAINLALKQHLNQALDEIISRQNIRVVILQGEGRAFCAGGDLQAIRAKDGIGRPEDLAYSHSLLKKLISLDAIVMSAVHGFAAGAGFILALAADLVYAARGTQFHMAFVRLGLVPDWGGMYLLPRLAGIRKAKEWMLFAETLDAETALNCGLVNAIFEEKAFFQNVLERAERLAAGPWTAIQTIKAFLNQTPEITLEEALNMELEAFSACMASHDVEEGINAFFEKRAPRFL